MAITDYSTTASSNTSVGGVNIQGTASAANMDNGLRAIMADIATALAAGTFSGTGYVSKSSGYTVVGTDRGKLINCSAALTLSLTAAATIGAGFVCWVKANGGAVVIDPNSTENINGSSTSLTVPDGSTVMLVCDGTGWQTGFNGLATLLNPTFQTFMSVTTTAAGNVSFVTSTDAGAGLGPGFVLLRDSASPAANDLIGDITFAGRDSAGNAQTYAHIYSQVVDPTSTSEDATLNFETVIGGTVARRLAVGAGIYTNNATSGDMGADTVNSKGYYVDGVLIGTKLTLVGTVTTTTGTTQSITGIATTYKALLLVLNSVSGDATATIRVALSSDNGSGYGTALAITASTGAANSFSGLCTIYNTGYSSTSKLIVPSTLSSANAYNSTVQTDSSTTGLINALQFSPSSGNFDAGSIGVYGIS